MLIGWDGAVRGAVAVADTVKPSAAAAVAELRGLGLHPVLLTGDNEATARAVAAATGIDEVIAGTLPPARPTSSGTCKRADAAWPWSGTGSTTRPRWPRPAWGWPLAPVRTSR